jgi:putative PIN family toxin of toxin-antitoxin system
VRVTADSNIYISAIYFKGKPLELIHRAVDGDVELAISAHILDEVLRVARQKFGASAEDIRAISDLLSDWATLFVTTSAISVITDDPSDNRILECAVDSQSSFLITGDRHLLQLGSFNGISIVTVADFFLRNPNQR